jgi:triphosphoribosyl-dephospho-CoA synthase
LSRVDTAIGAAFVEACLAELDALKPGNVHRYASGHRMEVGDFVRSAEASATHVAAIGLSIGARVRGAVDATLAAVGQNTNLGIVLLCAPLAAAAEGEGRDLRAELSGVLDRLDRQDAIDVYAAIAAARPGGLGRAPDHDVHQAPTVSLREAMAAAADRDRIARQYVTVFDDVFVLGFTALDAAQEQGRGRRWSTLAVYFGFLAGFPDTHVARKFGLATAEDLRREASLWRQRLADAADPEAMIPDLLQWDNALKARGVNPGTSADLTVATLFAATLRTKPRGVLPSSSNNA